MIRQYYAQRRKGGNNPKGIGTIDVGTIFYLQDGVRPLGGRNRHARIIRRNPWIVVAWHNRKYHPAVKDYDHTTFLAGGHLATVRSLRDGREQQVADWFLRWHLDNGFELEKPRCPAKPKRLRRPRHNDRDTTYWPESRKSPAPTASGAAVLKT